MAKGWGYRTKVVARIPIRRESAKRMYRFWSVTGYCTKVTHYCPAKVRRVGVPCCPEPKARAFVDCPLLRL